MKLPAAVQFVEAMENYPQLALTAHPDLARGNVIRRTVGPKLIYYASGRFAVVFKVQTADGLWAIKCFIDNELPELRQRYRAIATHTTDPTVAKYFVRFRLCEGERDGFYLDGQWWPFTRMEWSPGIPLKRYVSSLVGQGDRRSIGVLADAWDEMSVALREAGVAHGDVQPDNVLVEPRSGTVRIRLVDYEDVFVPELKQLGPADSGVAGFQHPDRTLRPVFDQRLADFSAIVMVLSLRALAADPTLAMSTAETELLIPSSEIRGASGPVTAALVRSTDPEVRRLTDALLAAAAGRYEDVPAPADVLESELRRTERRLLRALDGDEHDSFFAQLGLLGNLNFRPTASVAARLDEMLIHISRVRLLKGVIGLPSDWGIRAASEGLTCNEVTQREREVIDAARARLERPVSLVGRLGSKDRRLSEESDLESASSALALWSRFDAALNSGSPDDVVAAERALEDRGDGHLLLESERQAARDAARALGIASGLTSGADLAGLRRFAIAVGLRLPAGVWRALRASGPATVPPSDMFARRSRHVRRRDRPPRRRLAKLLRLVERRRGSHEERTVLIGSPDARASCSPGG